MSQPLGNNYGEFGRVPPFTFRDGILVDATGWPVPPLPKVATKGPDIIGGEGKLRKKFNPRMVNEDFDGRGEE